MFDLNSRVDRAKPRLAFSGLLLLCTLTSSGCASFQGVSNFLEYNDTTNEFVMGWRNSVWARQAWAERKHEYSDQPQFYSFGEGFRAGYEEVAAGGNGCPPGMAPRKFWTWKYQSPEGQAKAAAWLAGYPYGAKAAEEDGAGMYQQIQVSYPMEQQYSPQFLQGGYLPAENIPPGTAPEALPNQPSPKGAYAPPPQFDSSMNQTPTKGTAIPGWPEQNQLAMSPFAPRK